MVEILRSERILIPSEPSVRDSLLNSSHKMDGMDAMDMIVSSRKSRFLAGFWRHLKPVSPEINRVTLPNGNSGKTRKQQLYPLRRYIHCKLLKIKADDGSG